MIEHVTADRIDRDQWNDLLDRTANKLWYARSHVLDAASPGWEALIDRELGAIMPLTWRRKWGVAYLFQPFAVQQLGVFAPRPGPASTLRFLKAVPERFKHADIYLSDDRTDDGLQGWRFSSCRDHLIPVDRGIEAVRADYSTNHQRNLKRTDDAEKGFDPDVSVKELVRMMAGSPQFRSWGIRPWQVVTLENVLNAAATHDQVSIWGVRRRGRPIAGAFFVHWNGRTIFLKGLTLPEGRSMHAMHFLIDRMVQARCGKDRWLDLAGGNTPDLARFYAGFGAVTSLYLRAVMHRSPGWEWLTVLHRNGR